MRFIETLAIQVARFNIPEVGLAVKRSRVAFLTQYFCNGDLVFSQTTILIGKTHVIHAISNRVTTSDSGGAARRTGRLGIHPSEVYPLVGELVHVRRLESPVLL